MGVRRLFDDKTAIDDWILRWQRRLTSEPDRPGDRQALMRRHNPAIIPRNHRIEAVIRAAVDFGDFKPFHTMLAALQDPTGDLPEFADYEMPPQPDERVMQTFCGT